MSLSPIQILTVLAGIVTLILFIYEAPTLYRKLYKTIYDFFQPDLVNDLFGENADIKVLGTEEYENKLKEAIGNANRSVYHISIHGYTVDYPPEIQIFEGESVEQRYLLLNPEQKDRTDNTTIGKRTGIESLRDSPFDPDPLTTDDKFEDKFSYYYQKTRSGDWSNIDIRVYKTTPWLRCAIIDENKAGFKITPALYDGRNTIGFWTEDSDVVDRLVDIFDDIWYDERTVDLEPWYEEWSNIHNQIDQSRTEQ